MNSQLDHTHNPGASSWVPNADLHVDFPLQNLPLGVFEHGEKGPRIGCAIGEYVFDLVAFSETGKLADTLAQACRAPSLNGIFALSQEWRLSLRHSIFDALNAKLEGPRPLSCLYDASECVMHLPAQIGDYTDFYIGIHHATNIGRLFRPENPLLPNYKHVPIAYHGRVSTIAVSPDSVVRPHGQQRRNPDGAPIFGPSARLDYEVELGVWIAGENRRSEPVSITNAGERVAGLCLLNDWSARDIQAWEYQPLGPFLSKNFATTISPWVITTEALAPFRIAPAARAFDDPAPMAYLDDPWDRNFGGFSIRLECFISSARMRENGNRPSRISRTEMDDAAYWTIAQMIAHHGSGGCSMRSGDLLGTGTLSGPEEGQQGSLMELTSGGKTAIMLSEREERNFLEDGDEVTLRAMAHKDGFRSIGFGECRGHILSAKLGKNS